MNGLFSDARVLLPTTSIVYTIAKRLLNVLAKAKESPISEIRNFRDNSFNHSICVTIESFMIRQSPTFIHSFVPSYLIFFPNRASLLQQTSQTYLVALLYYVPQLHLLNKLSCVTANWVSGMKSKAMKRQNKPSFSSSFPTNML